MWVRPAARGRNFFHCCAFTFGIVQAGGAGRIIAEWVVHGEPDWDVWPLDCRRYLPFANRRYALAKALETYEHEYGIAYPQEERPAGRPAKTSPLYDRLKAKGAVLGVIDDAVGLEDQRHGSLLHERLCSALSSL